MFSRINCFSSSINEIRNSHMNPRCKLISTSNPLNPRLEQFFRGNSEHIAYFSHISEPIMSENSPKNILFSSHRSSLNSFIQLCEEHCTTVRHIRKILPPFSFSRVQLFSPPFHFFFIPFSFRFIFSPFNKNNFRCVFTKKKFSTRACRI